MPEELKIPAYGGQAVIEGVMMRGRKWAAIAMRAPNNEIVIHQEPLGRIYQSKLIKVPFLRGLMLLWDALGLGMRALTISANTQSEDDQKIEGPGLVVTMVLSLIIATSLFSFLPAAIGYLVERLVFIPPNHLGWITNVIEGLVRLLMVVGYIWGIGKVPDIQRVFAYHGAEHKTINAFEAGVELTPNNVSRFSVEHPRCGTAFLLTLVLLSVLLFTLIGPLPIYWRLFSRLILLPVLAGLAYEYIRFTANYSHLATVRLIVKPNLALQRLTTREPSLEMLEVSIAALQTMRKAEQEQAME